VSHFTVERSDYPGMPWFVRHTHSGLGAGSFYYKRHAVAAAKAMSDAAQDYAELSTPQTAGHMFSEAALSLLIAARQPHTDADKAQMKRNHKALEVQP